jgi:hypothetical protein
VRYVFTQQGEDEYKASVPEALGSLTNLRSLELVRSWDRLKLHQRDASRLGRLRLHTVLATLPHLAQLTCLRLPHAWPERPGASQVEQPPPPPPPPPFCPCRCTHQRSGLLMPCPACPLPCKGCVWTARRRPAACMRSCRPCSFATLPSQALIFRLGTLPPASATSRAGLAAPPRSHRTCA